MHGCPKNRMCSQFAGYPANGNELSLDFGVVEQLGAQVVAIASLVGGGAKDIQCHQPLHWRKHVLPFVQAFDESELR